MSLFSIIESILIGPLKLLFEIIYEYTYRLVGGNHGLAIIGLSLIINTLVLPLYKRADEMQAKARDIEFKLREGVLHIKKTFSGDERMMILHTYYRQNNYKPTDSLKGSVSLLLEIPFFIAAYQFLSAQEGLSGASFGPISDLAAPDALLTIGLGGGITINVLPIIMTVINCCSGALYLKGFPLKDKLKVYGMAVFFLVMLYSSPSGLVFYWTLNNVFSMVKNIFYKLENPKTAVMNFAAVCGILFVSYGALVFDNPSMKKRRFIVGIGLMLLLPHFLSWLNHHGIIDLKVEETVHNRGIFLVGSLFLTIFLGILIPSTYIAASPQEYLDILYFYNPVWYIVNSFCLAAGFFLVWFQAFYWLASPLWKSVLDILIVILSGVALIDYMFFGRNLGIISKNLQYDSGVSFLLSEKLINFGVLLLISTGLCLLIEVKRNMLLSALSVAVIAVGFMSTLNIVTIQKSVIKASEFFAEDDEIPRLCLSKSKKNVVVVVLDRAIGAYVPYIFNEKPELKEKFAGFTYYNNTISYGGHTNFGMPALYGGYEYTPVEMNKRNFEKLVDKHNEALKVLPVIFDKGGYDVTVCDPPYTNYQWVSDLSIYDEYPHIRKFITKGKFDNDASSIQKDIEDRLSNFFCFSIMKAMPVFFQSTIYDDGYYGHKRFTMPAKSADDMPQYELFMQNYNVLSNLPNLTKITNENNNTFMIMVNDITHEPVILKEPEYIVTANVDNSEYDEKNSERFIIDGKELRVENDEQMAHYHSNMAAMIQLGKWFDYLRENDVYDNTRIILASDHGYELGQIDSLIMDDGVGSSVDAESYLPLLMVKDFNSKDFTTSNEFMTNADVPTLALRGLFETPQNPFTGKPINNDEKYAHEQFIIMSHIWDPAENNGNTFLPSRWAGVKDNIWDKNNWIFTEDEKVLKEHKLQ